MDEVSGVPWSGGVFGEVVSPSGRRAYTAARAAQLADRTRRWATDLAGGRGVVESERGRIAGKQGRSAWFLIADSFEKYMGEHGNWPPPLQQQAQGSNAEIDQCDMASLFEENRALRARCNELLDIVTRLSRIAKTSNTA